MKVLKANCTRCDATLQLPLDALLVAVDVDDHTNDRLAYICPSCHDLVDEALTFRDLIVLLYGGADVIESERVNR